MISVTYHWRIAGDAFDACRKIPADGEKDKIKIVENDETVIVKVLFRHTHILYYWLNSTTDLLSSLSPLILAMSASHED